MGLSLGMRIRQVAKERGYEVGVTRRDGTFVVWTPAGGIDFERTGRAQLSDNDPRCAEACALIAAARKAR